MHAIDRLSAVGGVTDAFEWSSPNELAPGTSLRGRTYGSVLRSCVTLAESLAADCDLGELVELHVSGAGANLAYFLLLIGDDELRTVGALLEPWLDAESFIAHVKETSE